MPGAGVLGGKHGAGAAKPKAAAKGSEALASGFAVSKVPLAVLASPPVLCCTTGVKVGGALGEGAGANCQGDPGGPQGKPGRPAGGGGIPPCGPAFGPGAPDLLKGAAKAVGSEVWAGVTGQKCSPTVGGTSHRELAGRRPRRPSERGRRSEPRRVSEPRRSSERGARRSLMALRKKSRKVPKECESAKPQLVDAVRKSAETNGGNEEAMSLRNCLRI